MIDRHGKTVYVSWQAHELIWLQAALSLPRHDRPAAYRDIAYMSGRAVSSVQRKALRLEKSCRADTAVESAVTRRAEPLGPSTFITPISAERLRGGNGRVCRSMRIVATGTHNGAAVNG